MVLVLEEGKVYGFGFFGIMGVVLVEIDLKIGDLSDFKLVEFFLMFFIEYFYVISDYVVVF